MLLASLIVICSLFLFLPLWRRQIKLQRWRKSLSLNKHYKVYRQLYANVDGFALSKVERTKQDAPEYVYGEIDFESFIALLSLGKPGPSTVFYDLGSGVGKAVLACIMVFDVKKSCGIELFSSLHHCAQQQQQRLTCIRDYETKANRIKFIQGNFLETSVADANLIFINATAFFGETWLAISQLVEQIQPGALVITTSKTLRSDLFTLETVTQVKMSWGIVKAYIQQRQDQASPGQDWQKSR
ncbi:MULTISPECIES: hypothetical protein [Legionella]|uniref:hypothetical protein n=1 Tax=Legionella TaxID=445 RepID=UPI001E58C793|nr:hypothetical protein [Legionella sp. 31fI33]MCC5014337.1 hypothetical protein [Legionella sp. 31fI33]